MEPYIFWLIFVSIFFVFLFTQSQWNVLIFYVLYMILVPVLSIHFIHEKSILKILGLNTKVFLLFISLLFTFSVIICLVLPSYSIGIIPTVILIPIAEEFFFRAYMFRTFINPNLRSAEKERRTWIIIILSSFLFSVGHLFQPYLLWGKQVVFFEILGELLGRWVCGAIFCCLFTITKNILASIIPHMLWNLLHYLG